MRIPVFARGTNPRFDRAILRKSESYATLQVDECRADWIDPDDHAKGIICRGSLYFGVPRMKESESDSGSQIPVELPGLFFVPPKSDGRPRIATVRAAWDWAGESDYLPLEASSLPVSA